MKRIVPMIILLATIGGGFWWFSRPQAAAIESTALVGSGTIEAKTIAITAELGGRIVELKVDEGDEVTVGQVLAELDKSNLLAQQAQLEAALTTAKANLELVRAPARAADVAAAQAQLTQAEIARDGAKLIWDQTKKLADDPHELETRINQAQARVTEAERELEMAQVHQKRMDIQAEAASRDQSDHEALVEYEVAQNELQAAQVGIEMAEVALAGAKQQVELLIQLRDRPLQIIARANATEAAYRQADAAVLAAQANLTAVSADPTPEDVTVAQTKVFEAQAALAAIEVQLAKQTLTAPRNGLISQKLANPGELAGPGAMLLELSDIETVDLIVYIPETRIGQVKIGQKALVYVDAYQDGVFEGRVSFIAHQAEFTPRNVQTQEERVNLVFAVKITLDNADHRLKPGMPADADILSTFYVEAVEASSPTPSPQPTLTGTVAPTLSSPVSATPPVVTKPEAIFSPTSTPVPIEVSPIDQAEVVAWALKVRNGPGLNHAVVAHLVKGDIVPIIDVDPYTGWLLVQLPHDEKTGWISGNPTYVSVR